MRIPLAIALALIAADAGALQRLAATDGQSLAVRVSRDDLTRIRVEGGRIERVWGSQSAMEVQTDAEAGEVFLRPRSPSPFSFFVKTSRGTFTLVATPMDRPAETIVIVAGGNAAAPSRAELPYVARIKRTVRAMLSGNDTRRTAENRPVALWQEARVRLVARWPGTPTGEEYELVNVSGAPMRLDEREWRDLAANLLAVAIEDHELAPGESTRVFLVRGRGEGVDDGRQ